jgi:thiol:disulfide interchange protein DsbC
MFKKILFSLLLLSTSVQSMELEKALDIIQSKLKNSHITKVNESILPGIYEVQSGVNVFYYHLEKELIIFGEIYSVDGKNLTSSSKQTAQISSLSDISDNIAITLGDSNAVNHIVEFTNPDCGYCRKFHKFIHDVEEPIKRSIIFTVGNNLKAQAKAEHLICSTDPQIFETDYNRIMNGETFEFKTCEGAKDKLAAHQTIARNMRVEGTPVLFVNNVRVDGANLNKVRNLLIKGS